MKIRITAFLFITVCLSSPAQDFKKHIVFLASEYLHGRASATVDEKMSAEYIHNELISVGCASVSFQQFPFGNSSATNVIGILDFKKDSTVIISAHYDHLGLGSGKSLEVVKKGVHPGADDNASGVAMMIELARSISGMKDCRYNFVFAGFSAHEAGLYGSDYFSKSELCNSLKIRAVINFDMVGRLDRTSSIVRISGSESDERFSNFFKGLAEDATLHFRFDDENISQSDLKPFAERKIPVLNITTGIHDDYHKMSDTEDKINYNGMNRIFKFTESLFTLFTVDEKNLSLLKGQ